jgi:hypothetical protein
MVAQANPTDPSHTAITLQSHPKKIRTQFLRIPVLARVKARNMYLVQGLDYKSISESTGLDIRCLYNLAKREGWTERRKEQRLKLETTTDARIKAFEDQVSEAIAQETVDVTLSGVGRAREAVESRGEFAARDFQSWTGGIRNLVQVAKLLREPSANMDGSVQAQLNVFILRVGDQGSVTRGTNLQQPEQKNVTPTGTQTVPAIP